MRYLIAAAALLLATPAQAEDDWIQVHTDTENSDYYVRLTDLMAGRSYQTAATVWVKVDARRDVTVSWREQRTLYRFDCTTRYVLAEYTHLVWADGRTEGRPEERRSRPIVPGTVFEEVADVLCTDPDDSSI